MRMGTGMAAALLLAVGLGLAGSGCGTQAAPPDRGYAAQPCPAELTAIAAQRPGQTLECGVLLLPQSAAGSDTDKDLTVTLPVVRLRPATAVSTTPVIYLHGGPGGGVVQRLARVLTAPWAVETFTPDREWVFFDQRGAGAATPLLDCGELSLTDAGIARDSDLLAFGRCVSQLKASGVDFGQYNSVRIADDIQALRKALKFERFDLFGVSYGTRVALAVAQHRPDGLRAMVLDSPYPPEAKGTQALPTITAELTRRLLEGHPILMEQLSATLFQWERAPPEGLTIDDMGQYLVDTLYSSEALSGFPDLIGKLAAGDLSAVRAYVADRSVYAEAQNIAHFCKEELPFEDRRAMLAEAESDPIARAVARPAARYFEACELIAVGAADPKEAEAYVGPIPALFLVAGVDPGCPLAFAEPAAKAMPAGQLVHFPWRTHGLVRETGCARQMMAAFLAQPGAPVDRACLEKEPRPPSDRARR